MLHMPQTKAKGPGGRGVEVNLCGAVTVVHGSNVTKVTIFARPVMEALWLTCTKENFLTKYNHKLQVMIMVCEQD